jgi:hypothetical protein
MLELLPSTVPAYMVSMPEGYNKTTPRHTSSADFLAKGEADDSNGSMPSWTYN